MQFKLLRGRLLLVGIHSLHQVTDLSLSVLFGLHPCPHHPKHLVVLHHHFQTIYNRSMLAFKFTTRRNTPQYPPLRILFSNLIHGNIHKAVIREYHYPPPAFHQTFLIIHQYSFILLGGQMHCESDMIRP